MNRLFTWGPAVILAVLQVNLSLGADNAKAVQALLRTHAEAAAKADEVRLKSVDKSLELTIGQIIKLAEKAVREKDRIAETNAWKAVLQLDRDHKKAVKYFTDLGTLDQTLKDLPDAGVARVIPRFVGRWQYHWNSGAQDILEIRADGTCQFADQTVEHCVMDPSGSIVIKHSKWDGIDRFTMAGDRLLLEQWNGATFGKSRAIIFGIAVRADD